MIVRRTLADSANERLLLGPVLEALAAWDGLDGCAWQMHPGDVGWFMRFDDHRLRESFVWWEGDGDVVAVAMLDGALRTAVQPQWALDRSLAVAMADLAEEWDVAAMEVPPGACALRPVLNRRGYEPALEGQWLHLYQPLPAPAAESAAGAVVRAVADESIAQQRVAVHRAAFAPSTYTLEGWRLLAGSPAYRPDLDLVVYADGEPAAGVTAWLAGEGRCGLIEPLGTDPAHRAKGMGAAAVRAACERLSAAGAAGVAVWTPASNEPAAALYRSCGFRLVALHSDMHRSATLTR